MMEDFFKALLSGSASPSQSENNQQLAGDPLTDVLGAILGGGASPQQAYPAQQYQQPQYQQQAGDPLTDVLGAILGGASPQQAYPAQQYQQPQYQQPAGDPLTDVLGAILGGASPQQAYPAQQYQQPQYQQQAVNVPSAGGFAGIINGILGGGSSNSLTSSLAAPIAKALAKKFNLPPQIAQIVVTFVLGKLLSNAVGGPSASYAQGGAISNQGRLGGFGLEDLLTNMDGGQGFSADYLQSTGMVDALANRTGLGPELATQSMQEVFKMLSGQVDINQQ